MTLPLRLVALTLVVLTTAAFTAAPPPRPLGSAELQQLIEQLGDRDYRTRERAERKLLQEGTMALPLLRKALGHKDPEVRRRALRLVPGLEHAALVAPKRITLIVENQPLDHILGEVAKQTGYQIQYQSSNGAMIGAGAAPGVAVARAVAGGLAKGKAVAKPAGPKEATFSYTFINEPFWEVINRICNDANLYLQQGYGDEIVRLYRGLNPQSYSGRDGAFRYAATNMQLYRNINLNTTNVAASRSETLTLNLNFFAEPRLPFLNMAGEIRIEAAYDSEKNSMIPQNNLNPDQEGFPGGRFGRVYYGGGYKQMSIQAGLQLVRVSEKASTIKYLRGVAPVTILVEQRPVNISDDILKAKGKKALIGDLDFHIEDVQKQANNQYSIKFNVTNKGNPNDYTWQNTLYQRLELLDEKGQKFQNWGSNWHGGGNNSVGMTLTYNGNTGGNKPAEPKVFRYQHWVTRQHDIQFELRDVPLP